MKESTEVNGMIINVVDMVSIKVKMGLIIKGIGGMISRMDMDKWFILMGIIIEGNGVMGRWMVKGFILVLGRDMKGNGKMNKRMGMERSCGMMVRFIRGFIS